jgi:hypothetical protein
MQDEPSQTHPVQLLPLLPLLLELLELLELVPSMAATARGQSICWKSLSCCEV